MALEIKKSIDFSLLNSLFGEFHREEYSTIVEKYTQSNTLNDIFPSITMIKDELVVLESSVSEIMQPYQVSWTPKGTLSFNPELLKLRYVKADIDIYPNEIRSTMMAKYLQSAQTEENEIVRLSYEKYLAQAARDSAKALINGKYKVSTQGAASDAKDSCDGFREYIASKILSKQITPFTLGELSQENIVDKLEELYMSIPENFRSGELVCYMSNSLRRKYFFGYRDKFGLNNDYSQWDGNIDATNIKVVALPYMEDSQRIVFTMAGNFVQLVNQPTDMFSFRIKEEIRYFKFTMDWSIGFGALIVGEADVPDNQYIWCNELDKKTSSVQV